MYKQLTSEQRSQIFALLQRKCPRKEIARIVGISQSTLSRELRHNSTQSGKYIWFKGYCPQNVCKLQSSYICGEIANQTKNNEAYNGTKIGIIAVR